MRVAIGIALACATLGVATSARAQDVVELGEGASVQRVWAPCGYDVLARCAWWEPSGFSFGDRPELASASAFGRAPSGRIVALVGGIGLVPPYAALVSPFPPEAMLLYSDDLGASWQAGAWPDGHALARAFAFDPATGYGVAVGENGGIWSSDDGVRWRRRRSASGLTYVAAWVRGRTVVVADREGALWISDDGGFALSSLALEGGSVLEREGELVVRTSDRTLVIDARGTVRRR